MCIIPIHSFAVAAYIFVHLDTSIRYLFVLLRQLNDLLETICEDATQQKQKEKQWPTQLHAY